MSKQHYHTDWKPQFGDPILPPAPKKRRTPKRFRGSWNKPSRNMVEAELKKCRITRLDLETGEVKEVIEPTSHAKPKHYGETGKAPHKPRKR